MSKKWHQDFDFMKYVPLVIMAFSFVAGYVTLKNDVASAKNDIQSQKTWLVKQSEDNTQIKISQARTEEKVNQIYEAIKRINN